ncbi:MAG: cytosine permease [Micrococcales bacterium]|nr:cytosine permease [Micrococcales bacterium]
MHVSTQTDTPVASALSIETNALNPIDESERKGTPRSLFWPWFAANVSIFAVSYGAFLFDFGVSFWQATIIAIAGIVISFLFCGFISLAGKRGSAPTLTLSRAAFGVQGNKLPSIIAWIITVGWETVLATLAVLATTTVLGTLGVDTGPVTKIIALIVVVVLIIGGGIFGFTLIMRMQTVITIVTGLLTIIYIALVFDKIDFAAVAAIPGGGIENIIGGFVFMMTGFGLGWVQAAADYSRYLPRNTSSRAVVSWTTFGSALAPVILVIFGLLLAGSSPALKDAIGNDPIGALASILPTWFLIPFAIVAVLGLIGGAVLDIYSSGLALLSAGLRVPRWVAALIDGILMVLGTIYVVFFSADFFGPFQAFLITLGVPIAAWCGIFLADMTLRRKDYADADLFRSKGRYGAVNWASLITLIVGTAVGWGLVFNAYGPEWVKWQGYLLDALQLGGREGTWGGANLGVLVALVIGYLGVLLFTRGAVRRQEELPVEAAKVGSE